MIKKIKEGKMERLFRVREKMREELRWTSELNRNKAVVRVKKKRENTRKMNSK